MLLSVLFLHHFIFIIKAEKGAAAALVGKAGDIILIQRAIGIANVLLGCIIIIKISAMLALIHNNRSFGKIKKSALLRERIFLVEHSGIEPLTSTLPV